MVVSISAPIPIDVCSVVGLPTAGNVATPTIVIVVGGTYTG